MRTLVAGNRLRALRERLRLTLKEVESQSRRFAAERQNPHYVFTAGRLSQIENSDSLPSIYKLATLSHVYQTPYEELLALFNIDVNGHPAELDLYENGPEEVPAPAARGENSSR